MKHKQKIGLALGSGGLRGLAHIGIIKVLLKNNIPIDIIAGSSAGSLVGAYFATHGEVDSLEKLILENEKELQSVFYDFGFKGGFIQGTKLKKFLEKKYKVKKFEDTKIPFISVATDLISGQEVVSKDGALLPPVVGSMSVPLMFKPVKYKNYLLVDGGLSNPIPIDILQKNGATAVIAINLYHKNEFINKKFTMSRVAGRATRITLHNLANNSMKSACVAMNPDTSKILINTKLKDYFREDVVKELIKIGEAEAKKALPKIKKLIQDKK